MFKDQLNEYMVQLGCSGRELAEISGLSPATVSRYRSGERKPESEAERAKLISGIVQLAAARGIPALSEENVSATLRPFFPRRALTQSICVTTSTACSRLFPSATPNWHAAPIMMPLTSPASAADSAVLRIPSALFPQSLIL